MSYSTNMVYLYFHFKMNCEVVDSGWIYTTGSGKTKTLHHSVTSKMGRKASKMVTHTPNTLVSYLILLIPRILQHLQKGQKQTSSNAVNCLQIAETV